MNLIDDALLTSCIHKERKAQYELYRLSYSFLVSICIRYEKNREDADALVNQGFLKILNNIDKYRKEIPFGLWMRRVMINTVIDEYRKNKKGKELMQTTDFNETYDHPDAVSVNEYVRRADAEHIHLMIKELPRMSGRVFNLFAVDGFSHKEIASLLDMSEGTSKWHLNFARNKLKEMISERANPLKEMSS